MTTTLLPGTVTLVGAGPGDPELVTVAGLRAVQQAEVILYDRLAPQDLLSEASDDAELVPVGKIPRGHYVPQEEINQLLVAHAREEMCIRDRSGSDALGEAGEHIGVRHAGGHGHHRRAAHQRQEGMHLEPDDQHHDRGDAGQCGQDQMESHKGFSCSLGSSWTTDRTGVATRAAGPTTTALGGRCV